MWATLGSPAEIVRKGGRAVEVLAAVAVAVDDEQYLRLDLGEAVDDAARAELGRRARPDRADAGACQESDQRLGNVRHVGGHAIAALDAERAQATGHGGHLLGQLAPAQLCQRPQLRGIQQRRRLWIALTREHVLRIVELCPLKPAVRPASPCDANTRS